MRFIEIADEEALNLPADQLKAIAVYNQLCLNATLEQDDPEISSEHGCHVSLLLATVNLVYLV